MKDEEGVGKQKKQTVPHYIVQYNSAYCGLSLLVFCSFLRWPLTLHQVRATFTIQGQEQKKIKINIDRYRVDRLIEATLYSAEQEH